MLKCVRYTFKQRNRIYDEEGGVFCLTTTPSLMPSIQVKEKKMLRIRKLTEGECYRLMGFEKKDTEACKAVGQSKANIYHQAGDSIVTTVLVGLFGELIGADYHKAISDYADKLSEEVK